MKLLLNMITIAMVTTAAPALAESWVLDNDESSLAYGSIKKNAVGEVNVFETLSGTVSEDGVARIDIDLASVETNIDIRNERMMEHVFRNAGKATLEARFDMDEISRLAVGDSAIIDSEAVLSLVGAEIEFDAEMFVARLSETRVLVSTNGMVFLGVEEAGITAGIDKLMELASLPSITRTVPVTARFMFDSDGKQASATQAAQVETVAFQGDVKAGKKVFRKCKACHELKEGRNGAGPSLHSVLGAPAGQVAGFNYSDAMAQSGIVWTDESMAAFLSAPKSVVPGTIMQFSGLKKESDVVNLLAYLASETQ